MERKLTKNRIFSRKTFAITDSDSNSLRTEKPKIFSSYVKNFFMQNLVYKYQLIFLLEETIKMKIGIIHGHTQKDKNKILDETLKKTLLKINQPYEVINFGIYEEENTQLNYIQAAIASAILINSEAVDFIVTGCSSGTGMMLACNALPNVTCAYIPTASDAYLFGRINNGNAISLALGLDYGWGAELKLEQIFTSLFEEPLGIGYPKEESARKIQDTKLLNHLKNISQIDLIDILKKLDREFILDILKRDYFLNYLEEHSRNVELLKLLKSFVKS